MWRTAEELKEMKELAMRKLEYLENDSDYHIAKYCLANESKFDFIKPEKFQEFRAYVEEHEAYLPFYKMLLSNIFETDFFSQVERNMLDYDTLEKIEQKFNLRRTYRRWVNNTNTVAKIFKNRFSWIDVTKRPNSELREILAYFRSRFTRDLLAYVSVTFEREEGKHRPDFAHYFEQLARLEYLEEVITLGTLDLHIHALDLSEYMLNHEFGKGVKVNVGKLRYEKALAKKVKLDTKLKLSERVAK